MRILIIDCGSSPLKYQLVDIEDGSVVAKGLCERIGIEGSRLTHQPSDKDKLVIGKPMPTHKAAIEMVMEALQDTSHGVIKDTSEISAIGHRVLHGGTVYSDSIIVNKDIERAIRECFDLGPLHDPVDLMGIETCEAAMPRTPNVAVFDAVFGTSMPEKAYIYAIPRGYFEKYDIRRYGFHGISHKFVSAEAVEFGGLGPKTVGVIVYYLGNGSGVSAPISGKCVDTSMGLASPKGLTMETRSGDVDPAVLQLIMNKESLDINEALNTLDKKSGVYGMTNGISNDFRDIENTKAEDNHLVEVALNAFIYHVIKYVGTYTAAMNDVSAIAFTAGVDEGDETGKRTIYENLTYMGVKIDDELNNIRSEERVISSTDSKVKIMLVPTSGELTIIRGTLDLVQ